MHQITIKAINGYEMNLPGDTCADFTRHGEACWQIPEMIGTGIFKQIEFRSGFYLFIADYQVKQHCEWDIVFNRSGFGIEFCVSGQMQGRYTGMDLSVLLREGHSPLCYFPCLSVTGEDIKDTRRFSFSIIIEPKVFNTLVGGDCKHFPMAFRSIVDGTREYSYYQPGEITPEILSTLESILRCPLTGPTRRLFLESRILDLIARRLQQLDECSNTYPDDGGITLSDVEKIHQAASLLAKNMKNPPTLFNLARSVGISHAKMNRGFHQVFDTTVFGYLRKIRLQQAKQLLENHQMNVTEAAFGVGYNSLSSFSRAFFKQFGKNPHRFIRNRFAGRLTNSKPSS
ncbi:AraC family transcriptional regulator [Desulfosarcina ovata subsp. sediminis]|uniref:AraC family transcriptional regulator n=2 Tax=Desulfosarcina ovata TaxID=83564 RepID=A0A5K7ZYW9_9BACT|nr:AraC family transcriptional regulator [Desulfosarcina ovata subsp. sediminis]